MARRATTVAFSMKKAIHLRYATAIAISATTAIATIALDIVPATAQIVSDTTLPQNSIVIPQGNGFQINGGTTAGANLFHSFSEFSLPTGMEAFFNNSASIDNIITRITGSSISNIDGLIRANGAANLFLFNPNGIVFGPNARLDIGGSFLGTTAERILFEDRAEFSATQPENTLLTIGIPVGLQLGTNPGQIQVYGAGHGFDAPGGSPLVRDDRNVGLEIESDRTLALLGGDVRLQGGILMAQGGRIEIGAAENATIALGEIEAGWRFEYAGVENFRDVSLTRAATADASGTGDGAVQIVGRNVTFADGSTAVIQTQGPTDESSITVRASGLLNIVGTTQNPSFVPSGLLGETISEGRAASIEVWADRLAILNAGRISSESFGAGDSGPIQVTVTDFAEVRGNPPTGSVRFSIISGNTLGSGNGSSVSLSARNLLLADGGSIVAATFTTGRGGDVRVNVAESVELIGVDLETGITSGIAATTISQSGEGGNVVIDTTRLAIRDGARITTGTLATGNAGTLAIDASELIEVRGRSAELDVSSEIQSAATIQNEVVRRIFGLPDVPSGNSGNVILNTPQLIIADGGRIGALNEGPGLGGSVEVNASEVALLDSNAGIAASAASGEGGNITLTADRLQLRNQSQITTEAGGSGNGGNITLSVQTLSALENSRINANAFEGSGGNILIATEGIFFSPDSTVTASSQLGIDGIVQISNPEIETNAGLVELQQQPLDPGDRIIMGCASTLENSLTVSGRGGLPPHPEGLVIGDRPWVDLRDPPLHLSAHLQRLDPPPTPPRRGEEEETGMGGENDLRSPRGNFPRTFVEANGWIVYPDGQIELVALASRPQTQQLPANCSLR